MNLGRCIIIVRSKGKPPPTSGETSKYNNNNKKPTAKVQLLKAEDSEPIGGTEQ